MYAQQEEALPRPIATATSRPSDEPEAESADERDGAPTVAAGSRLGATRTKASALASKIAPAFSSAASSARAFSAE